MIACEARKRLILQVMTVVIIAPANTLVLPCGPNDYLLKHSMLTTYS
jgi:hypothetical protein